MKKILVLTPLCILVFAGIYYASAYVSLPGAKKPVTLGDNNAERLYLQPFAAEAEEFTRANGYNTSFCFLLDMGLGSGQNRFFVYDLVHDSIVMAGLVAHGSCNTDFLDKAKFSNVPGCGCSAKGKYKVGYKYGGRFGIAYKLYGLDSSNSNAFNRYIVLHSYYMVPDKEVSPLPIINSLGCTMVSDNFIKRLAVKLDASKKPVLLWMIE